MKALRRLIVPICASIMLGSVLIPPASRAAAQTSFSDVDPGQYSWALESIRTMSDKQVLSGYPDGLFYPQKPVSKAEWSTMVYKLFNKYRPNEKALSAQKVGGFADVPREHWAYEAISAIYDQSFAVGGYGLNRQGDLAFAPDKPMTRLQLATMLYSFFDHRLFDQRLPEDAVCAVAAGIKDMPVRFFAGKAEYDAAVRGDGRYVSGSLVNMESNEMYPLLLMGQGPGDCALGTDPLTNVMAKSLVSLEAAGIMTSSSSGYFRPEAPVTRAEAVTILHRIYYYMKKNFWLSDYTSIDLGSSAGGVVAGTAPSSNTGTGNAGTGSAGGSGAGGGSANSGSASPGSHPNNPDSSVMPSGTDTPGSNFDYFDAEGRIAKDLQGKGEINAGVRMNGEKYLLIELQAQDKEKVDLWITIDGQTGFAKFEELPMILDVENVKLVRLRTQWRSRKSNLADGMTATLSIRLSNEKPEITRKK